MIVVLTCQTVGCSNGGISIEVENPQDLCICGSCGQEITDKQPIN